MMLYETLVLAAPEITAAETTDLESFLEKTIKKLNASVRSFDRWGKYRLAYPIKKRDYGVYFLIRYEVDAENCKALMEELHNLFTVKLPQTVMRYMTSRLDQAQSLSYQKPESLEDMPTQDVDTFIRENKMEGLLKKPSHKEKHERPPAVESVEEVQGVTELEPKEESDE